MLETDSRHGYHITVEEGRFSDGTRYYTAMAPELRDCLFQADTPANAKEGLYDVISHMVDLIIAQGKTPPSGPVLANGTTVSFHQNVVITGFTGSLSTEDHASPPIHVPHSTAPQTTIRKQEGNELIGFDRPRPSHPTSDGSLPASRR